jgi:DNA polymerase-3 subunit gamma/tau
MNLALKYRPNDFTEVKGNREEIKVLRSLVNRDESERPHTYMLSGKRGIGKTTLARICSSVIGGDEISTYEYDMAQNTGVDEARKIKELAEMNSFSGAPTIFILDEFHRATVQCQEALLKILEEPPEHVYFFICTSKPNKVDKAVVSRAHHVKLAPLSKSILTNLVTTVAGKEGLSHVDKDTAENIADKADGSAREALQLLNAIATLGDAEDIEDYLGNSEQYEDKDVFDLYKLLCSPTSKWKDIVAVLNDLKAKGEAEGTRRAISEMACSGTLNRNKIDRRKIMILQVFSGDFTNDGFPAVVLACAKVYEFKG